MRYLHQIDDSDRSVEVGHCDQEVWIDSRTVHELVGGWYTIYYMDLVGFRVGFFTGVTRVTYFRKDLDFIPLRLRLRLKASNFVPVSFRSCSVTSTHLHHYPR